ncbi:MAG: integrase arm-type DNA-binding domain-containing protein [Nitrobacter sp.]
MAEKITSDWLQTATAARGQRIERMDSACRGLQVRISEGVKALAFVHRPKGGKPVKITLGHFPDLTLAGARKLTRGNASFARAAPATGCMDSSACN